MSNTYSEIFGNHPIGCRVFDLGQGDLGTIFPKPKNQHGLDEVYKLHGSHVKALKTHLMLDMPLPFGPIAQSLSGLAWGDFTTAAGRVELSRYRLTVSMEPHSPPEAIRSVWELMRLRRKHTIHHDGEFACLRRLDQNADGLSLEISPGLYSQAKFSMDAESCSLNITEAEFGLLTNYLTPEEQNELERLYKGLIDRFGQDCTIRNITYQLRGGLPSLNDGIYHHIIGMAGVILTSDGWVILTRRGSSVSVNHGINCPVSGGVDWVECMPSSVVELVARQTALEAHEEAGLHASHPSLQKTNRSLDAHITILGMVRELARGGSPEFLCCIQFQGSLGCLIETMASNGHRDKREIDRFIYALPLSEARRVPCESPPFYIHPKALLNLALLDRAIRFGTLEPP